MNFCLYKEKKVSIMSSTQYIIARRCTIMQCLARPKGDRKTAIHGRKRGSKMGKRIHDTTSDLFLNTIKMAREAGALDALDTIVDCEMPTGALTGDNIELTKYEFSTAFSVNIGACEGICIVAYIDGYFRQWAGPEHRSIGIIKTLREDLDAFRIMGEAAGALTYYAYHYLNKHLDRYTPEGEEEGTV